mgnify:CR=1 FL=1|tara:strand:+ start:6606 stop:6716 length:111 start_codon:yes stop_codon:yes gene_type:complete
MGTNGKKVMTMVITVAVTAVGVAGGLFVYNKYLQGK